MLTLKLIMGGYGVVLPLLMRIPEIGSSTRRWGILVPPLEFAPAFALAYYTYEAYPWDYSGEIVELMLGLGFLCFALVALYRAGGASGALDRRTVWRLPIAALVVMALGLGTAAAVRNQQSLWPENIKAAEGEIAALKQDLLAASDVARRRFPTRCGLHRRVHTYIARYEQGAAALRGGKFASLQAQGLPEERAQYFIDPWNAPYWIRDRCNEESGRRAIFIYSFGPNRKRDSSLWEILGDDIGAYVFVDPGRDGRADTSAEEEEAEE